MKKYLIFLMLLLILPDKGYAQEWEPGVISPQSWAFARYADKLEPDLYTGTMVFNVPIYTYEDDDFNIPISLGYASNGLIPNVQTGPLGLGWFLNAGGVISRQVIGVPDDTGSSLGYYFNGFGRVHAPSSGNAMPNSYADIDPHDTFIKKRTGDRLTLFSRNGNFYELNPDLFHFNFMGYKGTFMLGFGGEVHVFNTNFPEGEIDVKVSVSNGYIYITLTTGDGYKYEFNKENTESITDIDESNNVITNWLLCKITAPNGRIVSFDYTYEHSIDTYAPFATFQQLEEGHTIDTTALIKTIHSISKVKYLSKITIDNTVIDLDWGGKPLSERAEEVLGDLNSGGKLTEIRVLYQNQMQRRYTLDYYTQNTVGNPVLFLKSVTMPDSGIYEFDYYDRESSFPLLGSYAIDHWGYYNNRTRSHLENRNNFIPSVPLTTTDQTGTYYAYDEDALSSARRVPDPEASLMGMLKEVVYPTGGTSSFTYEANTFSRQVERSFDTFYLPALRPADSDNETAGGLRIKTIVETDNNGNTSTREFIYAHRTDGGNLDLSVSSGTLLKVPRYNTSYTYSYLNKDHYWYTEAITRVTSSAPVTLTVDKTHIEYYNVLERRNDGSSVEYSFTDYHSTPDETLAISLGSGHATQMEGVSAIAIPNDWMINNLMADPFSNHHNRGRLYLKTIRNSDDQLVYKERYRFDTSYDPGKIFKTWQMSMDRIYPMQFLLKQYRPISVERTIYDNGTPLITTTTSYGYNTANQTVFEETFDSRNRSIQTHRQFITDLGNVSGILGQMRNSNIVRYSLHERTKIQTSPSDIPQVIGGTSTDFTSWGKPAAIHSLNLSSPQPSPGNSIYMDSLDVEIEYTYDSTGNIIRTDERGEITSYVWGYGGLYLLAKVEGADVPYNSSFPAELSPADENTLRAIPGALVTTYSYFPLIGVKSVTDPSGRTTHYEYDSAGRLLRILNEDGHVLEQYEYNYATQ